MRFDKVNDILTGFLSLLRSEQQGCGCSDDSSAECGQCDVYTFHFYVVFCGGYCFD